MATEREPRNYKLKSRVQNLSANVRVSRQSAALAFSSTPVLVLRRQGAVARRSREAPARRLRSYGSVKSLRQTRSNSSVEHVASAREVLINTAHGLCKSSSSDAPFGCLAVPQACTIRPSRRRAPRERWRKARVTLDRQQTTDAKKLLRRHVRETHSRRALQPIGTDRRAQVN